MNQMTITQFHIGHRMVHSSQNRKNEWTRKEKNCCAIEKLYKMLFICRLAEQLRSKYFALDRAQVPASVHIYFHTNLIMCAANLFYFFFIIFCDFGQQQQLNWFQYYYFRLLNWRKKEQNAGVAAQRKAVNCQLLATIASASCYKMNKYFDFRHCERLRNVHRIFWQTIKSF